MSKKFIIIFALFTIFFAASCGSDEDETSDDGIHELSNTYDSDTAEKHSKLETTDKTPITYDEETETAETAGSGMFIFLIIITIILALGVPFFFWYFVPFGLWYKAWLSGVRIGWWKLVKMRFQNIPQHLMINTLIQSKNAGLKIDVQDLMNRYLAGVDIIKVTNTAIRAVNAGFDISYNELASQFLAKVNVETVMHALITAHNADLTNITLKQLAAHYLANVDVIKVVDTLVAAHNAGYDEFTLDDLKEHYLANGDVVKTVDAFIAAKEARYHDVRFKDIASIDLAGIDVRHAVDSAINPKVIETNAVSGVARDGVQLFMKLKLTLRANLKNIIGGATEQTVLARIDESLATEIGRAASHYDVLQSPFLLADKVEQQQLGKGTAFDVISVDVSEIRIGKDVHAELAIERAHAEAEQAKARLISAEEKVQTAMASAFLDGKLSVHEYHEIQNTEADTHMRKQLGDSAKPKNTKSDEHHH